MAETTFSKRVLPRLSDGSKGLSADFCKPIQLRAPYGSTDSRAHGSRNLSAPRPGHAPRWTTGPTASARVKTRLTARTRASVSISLRRTPVVQHGRGRAPSPARWRRSLEPSSPVGPKARSRVPLRTNHLVQRPFPAGASLDSAYSAESKMRCFPLAPHVAPPSPFDSSEARTASAAASSKASVSPVQGAFRRRMPPRLSAAIRSR